ncbi:MAG: DUF3365 domain-containing protein [Planctomycetes bacterium]|nr:DUF3365 domain-containing protein [Planctomycetota bacterium]
MRKYPDVNKGIINRKFHRSIGLKFLIAVGLFFMVFSVLILYRTWSQSNRYTKELLKGQADLALQFDLAIRAYVGESVRPFAETHVAEDFFVPETMSTSYVARSIFEKVRKEFPDYIIKFSSDDPRNPLNQAGPEELQIIDYFNRNPDAREWKGEVEMDSKKYLAHFAARRMKESCLRCHGVPDDAPKSMLDRYGVQAGFHRPVGEVVALDTVMIPIDSYQKTAAKLTMANSLVFLGCLVVLLAGIYIAFHQLVTRRLARISRHFQDALESAEGSVVQPLDYVGDDEIGVLTANFNTMAKRYKEIYESLEQRVAERTGDLKKANDNLATTNEELHTRMKESEKFNRLSVGRELRMIELKQEVNELALKAGSTPPYSMDYAQAKCDGADES